jgi:hypothetical protein
VTDEWLVGARGRLAAVSGAAPEDLELTDDMRATLLEAARIAAHESGERTNAPLVCYLLGRADRGADLEALVETLRR